MSNNWRIYIIKSSKSAPCELSPAWRYSPQIPIYHPWSTTRSMFIFKTFSRMASSFKRKQRLILFSAIWSYLQEFEIIVVAIRFHKTSNQDLYFAIIFWARGFLVEVVVEVSPVAHRNWERIILIVLAEFLLELFSNNDLSLYTIKLYALENCADWIVILYNLQLYTRASVLRVFN